MSDLYYNRYRVLRATWSVIAIGIVVAGIVVGVCLYSSYSDPDKSSAVRNAPRRAKIAKLHKSNSRW